MIMAKKPASKSKHKKMQMWKKFKVEGGKIVRPLSCPRCGSGTILAQHKNRSTCGRCSFSETKSKGI
jgi:small subunit ribosomal protein S27Ae